MRRLNVELIQKARFTWHLAREFALHYSCPNPYWVIYDIGISKGISLARTPEPDGGWQPFIGQQKEWAEAVIEHLGRPLPEDHHIQSHHTFPVFANSQASEDTHKLWFLTKHDGNYGPYHNDKGAILIDRFMGYLWHVGADMEAKARLIEIDRDMVQITQKYSEHYQ